MIRPFSKIFFLLFLCLISAPSLALDIEALRFGQHPDKTRIVIETSDKTEFKSFLLSNPNRLIIDLPQFIWQAGESTPPTGSDIKNVRHAVYKPGFSRIVFELSRAKTIKSAFFIPAKAGKNNRIVIDLERGASAPNVHGTLDTTVENLPPARQPAYVPPPPETTYKKPLIVIDAGHGGNDPGAISPQKYFEKNIVLSLAKELKSALETSGKYRVKLTRDNDTYIKLGERVNLSRSWEADMFISLHADSINDPSVRGASVYTLSNKASDAQTAKLAQRENRADIIAGVDLSHEDADVSNILIDLAMRDTMNQSRFFANLLVDSFKANNVSTLQNTHRYAGFAVLKAPDVPSVLIEAGFLSNSSEAASLSSQTHRAKITAAIRNGVDAYFVKTRS